MDKFEKLEFEEAKYETQGEKAEKLMREIACKLQAEGVPVGDDCRINMDAFSDLFSEKEIGDDQQRVNKYLKRIWGDLSKEKIQNKKKETSGEKLEMLKTALFHKFLGDKFIVVRTSLYDDFVHGIDNLIVNRESGDVVCAFDEVGDTMSGILQDKKDRILMKNVDEKGGKLKYGINIRKDKNGQMRIAPEELTNIPIFYLALPDRHIESSIKNFTLLDATSKEEKKLFDYFIKLIEIQMEKLEKKSLCLTNPFNKRIGSFKWAMQEIKKRYKL